MSKAIHSWKCPLCMDDLGKIERQTEFGLIVATANHMTIHMDEASLHAIDRARLQCTEVNCSIGKAQRYSTAGIVPKLTDYDRKFLSGLKIQNIED